jgi:hypothetical protein
MFDRIQVWFGAGLLSPFDIRIRYHQELRRRVFDAVLEFADIAGPCVGEGWSRRRNP